MFYGRRMIGRVASHVGIVAFQSTTLSVIKPAKYVLCKKSEKNNVAGREPLVSAVPFMPFAACPQCLPPRQGGPNVLLVASSEHAIVD